MPNAPTACCSEFVVVWEAAHVSVNARIIQPSRIHSIHIHIIYMQTVKQRTKKNVNVDATNFIQMFPARVQLENILLQYHVFG